MSNVIRIGNYRLMKTLGKGSFGKVKLAEHVQTGHKVAVKIINRSKIKSSQVDKKIRREIKILKLFRHPHIIRLYEVIETKTDIFMVMEYVSGGELFDHIVSKGKLSEDEGRRFFQQIISGVEYCHRFMVVHRDLKPENLLLNSDKDVKIADFGLSNIMEDGDFLKTSCGSPNYAAPEVISGNLYAGPEVDVWSCGVILYALLCGRLPFDEENIPTLFSKIKEGNYTIPSYVPEGAKDLIRKILVVNPMNRITIAEIRAHPWFQSKIPNYLSMPPAEIEKENTKIDQEILHKAMEKIGGSFDRDEAVEAIRNGEMNSITVGYYLLLDQKRRFTGDEPNSPSPASSQSQSPSTSESPQSQDITVDMVVEDSKRSEKTGRDVDVQDLRIDTPSESRDERWWRLGVMSSLSSKTIMKQVYQVLKTLDMEWKVLGPFNLKCRFVDTESSNVMVGIQLYRTGDGKYLLDIRKLGGDTIPFMDVSARLHQKLDL
eukprot:gb/GECH01014196.1/.p1 GENE.gb/GECH01014196.1/~~gb/GECH01014196.1/.p1  ORF type:complete len:488 (+),score=126.34 gb/GECH01014196.1/:1-1464(+)